jgi:ABC-type antimicrobial peptide transport system, ATPase component
MIDPSQTATHVSSSTAVVVAEQVTRDFQTGAGRVQVLRAIDLTLMPGEFIALQGRSGSGKSTLLNILVGLNDPTQGNVTILGQPLRGLNEQQRAAIRRERIGILFQNAHLLPTLTAQENVEIALRLLNRPAQERRTRALAALERVGLQGKAAHRGLELSGGEQQRVALARALVHEPRFIIADEPTGNLDSQTGHTIIALLQEIVSQGGVGLLVATHDQRIASAAQRTLRIQDGRLI